jgi:selenoprotein W-related protein
VTDVTIEYCVPCGYRERALALQEAVLASLETELESARLVMGDHGIFRVSVDGETIYDKDRHDSAYDVDDVVRAVHDEL